MKKAVHKKQNPILAMLEIMAFILSAGFLPSTGSIGAFAGKNSKPGKLRPRVCQGFTVSGKFELHRPAPIWTRRDYSTSCEQRRAMVILSFLGHAYVWGDKEAINSLPACLAAL